MGTPNSRTQHPLAMLLAFLLLSCCGVLSCKAQAVNVVICSFATSDQDYVLAVRSIKQLEADLPPTVPAITFTPKLKAIHRNSNRSHLLRAAAAATDCHFAIGTGTSSDTATVLRALKAPVIEYAATAPTLFATKLRDPVPFSRVIPSDDMTASIYSGFLMNLNWKHVNIIATQDVYGTSLFHAIEASCYNNGGYVEMGEAVWSGMSDAQLGSGLRRIQSGSFARVIVVIVSGTDLVNRISRIAGEMKMNETHVFVFTETACATKTQWNLVGSFCLSYSLNSSLYLQREERIFALKLPASVEESVTAELYSAGFTRSLSNVPKPSSISSALSFPSYLLDATRVIVSAGMSSVFSGDLPGGGSSSVNYTSLHQRVIATHILDGISGDVQLDSDGNRKISTLSMRILNIGPSGTHSIVGSMELNLNVSTITLDTEKVYWRGRFGGTTPTATDYVAEEDKLPFTIIIVILCFAIVALFVSTGSVLIHRHLGRPERFAPVDESNAISILFCDIYRQSNLWESVPEEMARAIPRYGQIVATAVQSNRGYQIPARAGDYTRAVFTSADDALACAHQIQLNLHAELWNAPQMEETYKDLDRLYGLDCYVEGYETLWNGPRARVALHLGYLTIDHDRESNKFSYSGAPLLETQLLLSAAHGGQVVGSDAFFHRTTFRSRAKSFTDAPKTFLRVVGAVTRGDKLIRAKECLPFQLAERIFKTAHRTSVAPAVIGGATSPVQQLPKQQLTILSRAEPPLLAVGRQHSDSSLSDLSGATPKLDARTATPDEADDMEVVSYAETQTTVAAGNPLAPLPVANRSSDVDTYASFPSDDTK